MTSDDRRALLEECLRLNGEIRMPSIGSSMWPDIHSGDELKLKQVRFEQISPGDIVLFSGASGSDTTSPLVGHRVLKTYVESGRAMLLVKGDNRTFADPPIFYEQVIGRVEEAVRAGQIVYRREGRRRDRVLAWRSRLQEAFWTRVVRVLGRHDVAAETRAIYQLLAYNLGWLDSPHLDAELDWERLYGFAAEGRLTPVLSYQPAPGAPGWFRERCKRDLRENQARQLLLYSELDRILTAFAEAGVTVMVVKGPVTADTVYPDPRWRPMVDLDLVVRREDWSRGIAVLEGLDFEPEHSAWSDLTQELTGQVALLKALGPTVCAVELHRDLRILSERLAVRGEVDLARAWVESKPYREGPAQQLSPEDAITYASTHWAQHHFFSSIWLVDIALMAAQPRMNWDKLVRQCREDGTSYFLWSALFLCQSLLSAPVPQEVLSALQPPRLKGALIGHLVWEKALTSFHERADARSLALQLLLFMRWRWTLAGLWNGVFPSGRWLQQHYAPIQSEGAGLGLRLRHWANLARLIWR